MSATLSHPHTTVALPTRPGALSPKGIARIAGLAYLGLAVLTWFANAAAATLYVPGDAPTTAARLAADPAFVRMAVAADLAGATLWVILALVLGRLLLGVDRDATTALIAFTSLGAGILIVSAVPELVAMRVATGAVDLSALGGAGSPAVALLLMDVHHFGGLAAAVFMGLWLLPFGLLARRSGGLLPAWIGTLFLLGGACYLVHVSAAFLAPDLHAAIRGVILLVPTVPEVAMVAFLLAVGVRRPRTADPSTAA